MRIISLILSIVLFLSAPFVHSAPALAALSDSDTIGSHGYDVHSRGEAYIGGYWPRGEVWEKLWNVCSDSNCNGSWEITNDWPSCSIDKPRKPGSCKTIVNTVTVKVEGNYGSTNWNIRDDFMSDLLQHHYGDGGSYYNNPLHEFAPGTHPSGWVIASNTWIRKSSSPNFWVNVEMRTTQKILG